MARSASDIVKRRFRQRLIEGKVVPVISRRLMAHQVLRGYEALIDLYAEQIEYPLDDRENLRKMTRFRRFELAREYGDIHNPESLMKGEYLEVVARRLRTLAEEDGVDADMLAEADELLESSPHRVSEMARRLGYPRFGDRATDPLLILADLPFRVYLTTSPYTFMQDALRAVDENTRVRTAMCPWNENLDDSTQIFEDGYRPSSDAPLVYHLHGRDTIPESLVLTEDDYLEFVVAMSQGQDDTYSFHSEVINAIGRSSLLFLGFNLPSWDFRSLFWGLIKQNASISSGKFILQLINRQEEREYLDAYLKKEARLEIEWKSIEEYTAELRALVG